MSDESPIAAPRLALLGANALLGREVKVQLAAAGFPADALTLFDFEDVAGLLTDYGDEARVVLETVADDVIEHDVVCLCGDRQTAHDYLQRLRDAEKLGVDCTGAWLAEEGVFPWIPGISAAPSMTENRAVVVPQAATLVLGATMAALGDLAKNAAASVFIPASEHGDAGLRELSQQSTAVMNLLECDTDVFGRQMAFDMWAAPDAPPGDPATVASVLSRLNIPAPAISQVAAPIFHGMTISMFIPGGDEAALAEALQSAGVIGDTPIEGTIDSPLTVVGNAGLHARIRADAAGCWIWIVADNLHVRAAAAVAAVLSMTGSSVSDAVQ